MKHCAGVWGLALAVSAGAATAETLPEILARGSLRACVATIHPALVRRVPDGCTENCAFAGLVVDQVRAFVETLDDVAIDLREVGWTEQFADAGGTVTVDGTYTPELLADGSCDLYVSNLARLPWREKMMTIVPLFESRMIVLVQSERAGEFPTLEALAGRVVSVQPDSSFHTWVLARNEDIFRDNPLRILEVNPDAPMDDVAAGRADFTLTDADIAVFAMNERPADIVPVFSIGDVQALGWGMARDNGGLAQAVATFFAAQRADTRSALNQAWVAQLGLTIAEFEALARALPNGTGPDG